ncbi:hypothetical protein N7532_005188 [Penicillium argentinense]|uniref:Zn(2)-C6 fungal-type domain-containing protein n=1 Tax=Penicillium argentinense TaxID=1131581 RepID=A0A9W9FDI7_9EURO|nr:uncharacterized protein N7532_005188 [Penicillium argentinense]KAJ5098187.1 hypothetical protein N7532_005188 [Penicillium argentinense]
MSSTDSKTKLRPQQSCLKCRERKVKCDRSRPCHACIIRGLEADCTYLATAEDHAHISQAEIIDRLRREVAQLRGQLSHGPRPRRPSPGSMRQRKFYARTQNGMRNANTAVAVAAGTGAAAAAAAGGGGSAPANAHSAVAPEVEGSWAGSSPSSSTTTMTNSNSVTMTSPDSTGSENGQSAVQSMYPAAGPFRTRVVEENVSAGAVGEVAYSSNTMNEVTVSYCHTGVPAFGGDIPISMPMQGISSQPVMQQDMQRMSMQMFDGGFGQGPGVIPGTGQTAPLYEKPPDSRTTVYPQNWGNDAIGHPFIVPYSDSSYFSSINTFDSNSIPILNSTPTPNPNPQLQMPPAPISQAQVPTPAHVHLDQTLSQRDTTPNPIDSVPESWKGEGKQELLEILLETISSCDESSVAQVVGVVRTSATPEEAVSGICQVLGISAGRVNAQ